MSELPVPDLHHFNAASGWLDLGNAAEAAAELGKLTAAARGEPLTLELEWRILAADRRWAESLAVAESLVRLTPAEPTGWIHQSYCLHELKRTREAWDRLRAVADRFLKTPTIPYNLACYACQLGNLELARFWLDRAGAAGDRKAVRKMAAGDPDLAPIWAELRTG